MSTLELARAGPPALAALPILKVHLHNTFGVLDTLDDELRREVHLLLSYEVPGAAFAQEYRPAWDGRKYFLRNNNQFLLGLYPRLHRHLRARGIPFETVDHRQVPVPTETFPFSPTHHFVPRPYQVDAVIVARERPRGVFVIGTGGGKSLTLALIVAEKRVPALVIASNLDLKVQLFRTLADLLPGKVGLDMQDHYPIIVANIQALPDFPPKSFERFGLLAVDEFHHAAADSYQRVNGYCTQAYYRYGFTGTFMRSNGVEMEMHGVLADVIFRKSTSDLIEEGYLARPTIHLHALKLRGLPRRYQDAYTKLTENRVLNEKIARLVQEEITCHRQVLVLVRRLEHGRALAALTGAPFLNGDDKLTHREEMKTRFNEKKLSCLIASEIFGEGVDVPSIDVLINARFQKTEIQTKQGIGRALRLTPDKTEAVLHDFLFTGTQPHLLSHSLERLRSYRSEPAFRLILKHLV